MARAQFRIEAANILERIEVDQAYANVLLSQLAKEESLGADEFRVVQRLVRGVLETRVSIDKVFTPMLSKGKNKIPIFVLNILRIAIYQLRYLERVPDHVIVNESVEVVKASQYVGLTGLVNAILRRVIRETPAGFVSANLLDEVPESDADLNHPQWMIDRWTKEFGREEALQLCKANNLPWPVYIRGNTLKVSIEELERRLLKDGVKTERSKYARECLIIREMPHGKLLHKLESFESGLFFVQDESSILVTELIAAAPGETVIDLCCAPGGKTLSIAIQMMGKGQVLAIDVKEKRLQLVRENCSRLEISNVDIRVGDGKTLAPESCVDAVLVDAPCSGLGTVGRRADLRWNKTEDQIDKLLPLQKELLKHAATLVKPGGRLVYSTCSIEIAEDEGIVEDFLLNCHGLFKKVDLSSSLNPEVVSKDGYLRTWPHRHQTAGAFGALLTRVG